MANKIQLRRDTTANWVRVNPILDDGEPGLDIDNNQIKYGDGSTAWADLAYAGGSPDRLTKDSHAVILGADGKLNFEYGNAYIQSVMGFHFVSDEPIDISSYGNHWNFNTDGTLTLPNGLTFSSGSQIFEQADHIGAAWATGLNIRGSYTNDPIRIYPYGDDSKGYNAAGIVVNQHSVDIYGNSLQPSSPGTKWTFGSDGNLTLPGKIHSQSDLSIVTGTSPNETMVIANTDSLGEAWRLIVDDRQETVKPALIQVGAIVTVSWGTHVAANVIDISHDIQNHLWYFTVDQNILTGFSGGSSAIFSPGGGAWIFGIDGKLTTSGPIAVTSNNTSDSGTGYAGIFKFTNNNFGAIHTDKSVRMSDTGNLQIINSAYSNTLLDLSDSGDLTIGGNVTVTGGGKFIGDGSQLTNLTVNQASNIIGSQPNVNLVAGSYTYTFDNAGNFTMPANGTVTASEFSSYAGTWTLAAGANTVNFSVPSPGTYTLWVNGNVNNGIVTYTATVVVTNQNVPVLGTSYGWYYATGNALVLTAIPAQIIGTANGISTATVTTTTAWTFNFGITNNSGTSQSVSYGYTRLG